MGEEWPKKCPNCGEKSVFPHSHIPYGHCLDCKTSTYDPDLAHRKPKELMSQSELNRIKSTKIDLGKYFNANGTGKII